MKASGLDIAVLESPKTSAVGEKKTWTIDFAAIGMPGSVIAVTAYDPSGADESATTLSGATNITGSVVTLKTFTAPNIEGQHFLVCKVDISGNEIMGGIYVAVFPVVHAPATISPNAYGTVQGVASLVPRYANRSGTFGDTTRPTQADVVDWIGKVSSILNAQLAQNGFTTPVTDPDVKPMLALFVEEEVASIAEGVNGLGRFSPRAKSGGGSRFRIVFRDVAEFIEQNAIGMAAMGASRPVVTASGIGFRDTDERGHATFPMFERNSFGDGNFQQDWDKD